MMGFNPSQEADKHEANQHRFSSTFSFLGSFFFMLGGYKLQKDNKSPEFYFIVWKKKKNGEYITVEFVRWIMQTTISIHQIACTFFLFLLDGLFISASIKFFIIICRLFSAALGFFESTFRTILLFFVVVLCGWKAANKTVVAIHQCPLHDLFTAVGNCCLHTATHKKRHQESVSR